MKTVTREKFDIKILQTNSPVLSSSVWQIESFCLKILEYGDYSFRKALAGQLSSRLQCTFFTSQNNSSILSAAGCLYSVESPAIAILGPVCTDPQYRKKGMASQICGILLEHLKTQKIQAVYLGVKDNVPALNLYKKLGFIQHSGIVMRRLFVSENEFNRRYSSEQQTIVRKIDWQDFAQVSALFCEPLGMHSFDFCNRIFSAKYVEVQTFLPVFPSLMNFLEKNDGYGNVLQTKEHSSIVGAAFVKPPLSKIQNHIAILDFFVRDEFLDRAKDLVSETLKCSGFSNNQAILCYCPSGDLFKKQILLSLGAEPYAVLPDFIRMNNELQDTIIYKFTRKSWESICR
jgi:RimJ/RimL family protein N-acetyltransferase